VVVANSKCLQDRQVAINRRQISQKWPRLHRLPPRKHRQVVVAHHLEDPLASLEYHPEIIRSNILKAQSGLRHT